MTATHPRPTTYRRLNVQGRSYGYFSLGALDEAGDLKLDRLPNALKVLLENVLRAYERGLASIEAVLAVAAWRPRDDVREAVPFRPRRILMQDFTGVPALVDLAALRDAVAATGLDAAQVNPRIPVDLVVDHSIMLEHFDGPNALQHNMAREFARNAERYRFLHWAQRAFSNLRIVPPGGGICHQGARRRNDRAGACDTHNRASAAIAPHG